MELIRYVLCPGCEMTTAAGGTVVPPDTGWRERGRSGPGAWGTRRGAANDAAAGSARFDPGHGFDAVWDAGGGPAEGGEVVAGERTDSPSEGWVCHFQNGWRGFCGHGDRGGQMAAWFDVKIKTLNNNRTLMINQGFRRVDVGPWGGAGVMACPGFVVSLYWH